MSINNRIEKIREDLGVTKTEFAKKIGISQQVYSNYSNGRDIPSSVLQQICKLSGVDANYLLLGEEARRSDTLTIPFHNTVAKIKNLNNKLNNFSLKAIIAFIFLLEEQSNILTIEDMIKKLNESYPNIVKIKLSIKNPEFSTKSDKNSLIKDIEYFLDDEDVATIFMNKEYYLKFLNHLKSRKRW